MERGFLVPSASDEVSGPHFPLPVPFLFPYLHSLFEDISKAAECSLDENGREQRLFASFSSLLKNFQIKTVEQYHSLAQRNESGQIADIPTEGRGRAGLRHLAFVGPLWI